jgi:chromosome segregation ATPase
MTMAKMTSQQIKDSMKPFKDFVTAVWASADITESAELAEAALPKLRQEAQDLKTVMTHLTDARAAADQETANARERARVALVAAEAEEAKLHDVQAKVAEAEAKLSQAVQARKDLHARLVQA